uniref:Immunoglobulin V-set domain-containing protein n=1 Tax=Acanthochromis polyacanthus TaxID=80966 RepID=A0A3Q1GBP1_9TELE
CWWIYRFSILNQLILPILLTAGFSLGLQVDQSPPAVFKKEDDEVKLFCTHEKSDYRMMLWYQKSPGETALKLIGYGYVDFKDDGVEEPFRKDFKLAGDLTSDKKNGSLSIVNLKAREHTATYFCAASQPQCLNQPSARHKNLFLSLLSMSVKG